MLSLSPVVLLSHEHFFPFYSQSYPEVCFEISCFSLWGMKAPSPSWLVMVHFFGYQLTIVGSSYSNGYSAKFMSLLCNSSHPVKLEMSAPIAHTEIPSHSKDWTCSKSRSQRDRELKEMWLWKYSGATLQNEKNPLCFQSPLSHPITYI